jgi:hypothetical protein
MSFLHFFQIIYETLSQSTTHVALTTASKTGLAHPNAKVIIKRG